MAQKRPSFLCLYNSRSENEVWNPNCPTLLKVVDCLNVPQLSNESSCFANQSWISLFRRIKFRRRVLCAKCSQIQVLATTNSPSAISRNSHSLYTWPIWAVINVPSIPSFETQHTNSLENWLFIRMGSHVDTNEPVTSSIYSFRACN